MFKILLKDNLYVPILDHKTITITITDYNKTDLWFDKFKSHLPVTDEGEYTFFIIDPISKEELIWKKYDDFYGPVVFNVYLYTQTIEQIMADYMNEDGYVIISMTNSGMGGGNPVVTLMRALIAIGIFKYPHFSANLGFILLAEHVAPFTLETFLEKLENSRLVQKYTSLSIPSQDFLDYLHERIYWTMDDLKVSFESDNETEIIMVMSVLMFSFDRVNMTFKRPDKIRFFSKELPAMDMKDVFKILTYYLINSKYGLFFEDYDYKYLQSTLTEKISTTTIRAALLSIDKELGKNTKIQTERKQGDGEIGVKAS